MCLKYYYTKHFFFKDKFDSLDRLPQRVIRVYSSVVFSSLRSHCFRNTEYYRIQITLLLCTILILVLSIFATHYRTKRYNPIFTLTDFWGRYLTQDKGTYEFYSHYPSITDL